MRHKVLILIAEKLVALLKSRMQAKVTAIKFSGKYSAHVGNYSSGRLADLSPVAGFNHLSGAHH
jgi:hypothetical protein